MKIDFAPRGILMIDGARITHRNFSGIGSKYNREGDRNFSVIIEDQEIADALMEDKNKYGVAWNVKVRPPREEGDDPFMYLPVKIKIRDTDRDGRKLPKLMGPDVYLRTGNRTNKIDLEDIDMLDDVEIESVDLDIRPYDDIINGNAFRAAYLQAIRVTQRLDRFASRFVEEDEREEAPF